MAELVRCSTCGGYGPDVREVGTAAGRPIGLCKPCRERQGFEHPARSWPWRPPDRQK